MPAVTSLSAKEIPDSRGKPTVEVELALGGAEVAASVPSGASVGAHEAKIVPAAQAASAINSEVAAALVGKEFTQQTLDSFLCALDGTPDKGRLGANAILAVSIAFARAMAEVQGVPLYQYLASLAGTAPARPCPMFNLINGGKHADSGLDIQEFLLVPAGIAGTKARVAAGMACAAELEKILKARGQNTVLGDEGGFAPHLGSNEEALEFLSACAAGARLSIDAAANSFYAEGAYRLRCGGERTLSPAQLADWWVELAQKYNLLSIEDPFAEDDAPSFAALQARTKSLVVGDDLTVTQAPRIARVAGTGAIKAVILKPNQVGSVSEAIDAAKAARAAGLTLIASHRSGETLDSFIADFAVGLACDYLKAGAPTRPERLAKYNRLMEIAQTIES